MINVRILFYELKQKTGLAKIFLEPEKEEIAVIFHNEDVEPPFGTYGGFTNRDSVFSNILLSRPC